MVVDLLADWIADWAAWLDPTWTASLCAVVASLGAGAMVVRRWWLKQVAPRMRAFDRVMLLLQGRAAVTLPEDPNQVLRPALPGALERLGLIDGRIESLEVKVGELHDDMGEFRTDVGEVRTDVAMVRDRLNALDIPP